MNRLSIKSQAFGALTAAAAAAMADARGPRVKSHVC